MSTLAEIEAEIEILPRPQQEMLLQHLATKLHSPQAQGAAMRWPVPPPAVPVAELHRIGAVIAEEFSRVEDWK